MASRHVGRNKNTQTISSITGENEKIQEIVEATKIGRDKVKAKKYFIVVTHLKGSHLNYTIFFITQTKDVLRLKQRFALIDLKVVDFLANNDSRLDFLLTFNDGTLYHFITDAWDKKKNFLVNLWKLCKNILPKEALPSFKSVNTRMLEEKVYLSDTLKEMEDGVTLHTENVEHEYKVKYLTKEEEIDLEEVCMNCVWENESAEEFIFKRSMELSGLDKANIHSIMNVEEEVSKLFETMDEAIKELDLLDNNLHKYSKILTMEESKINDISNISSGQSTRIENNIRLLEKSQELVDLLMLPCNLEDLDTLNDYNLDSFSKTVQIVQEKVDILSTHELKDMFCARETVRNCNNFLKSVPELLYNELTDKFKKDWQGKHRARHVNVAKFTSLLNWCKEFYPAMYHAIKQSYEETIRKCYEKEIANFFKDKVGTIQKRSNYDKGFSFAGKSSATSVMDISASQRNVRGSLGNIRGSLGSVDSVTTRGSGDSMSTYQHQSESLSKFDALFCRVLDFITPLVVDEEEHLHEVFGVPMLVDIPADASDEEVRITKEDNEMTNNLLIQLFGAELDQDLKQLIEVSYKVDNYYSLYMFLRLVKQSHNQDSSTFLKRFYYSCLVLVKRQFDQFIKNQVTQIADAKAHKSRKCGILHCVHKYDNFLKDTERLFDRRERRNEIEKGYKGLLEAIFHAIDRISKEQQRVPAEVVVFENYHHIIELLNMMKLPCLSDMEQRATKQYNDNLNDYVSAKLGNPIEKISAFFTGVKQSLSSAMREEEVGFQINYSRSVLKNILKQYSLKEVRKSIEHFLSKIEKHLCEEEDLYELVSQTYCNNILNQLTDYQDLLKRCYPDSGLKFEFNNDEIRWIFENRLEQSKMQSRMKKQVQG